MFSLCPHLPEDEAGNLMHQKAYSIISPGDCLRVKDNQANSRANSVLEDSKMEESHEENSLISGYLEVFTEKYKVQWVTFDSKHLSIYDDETDKFTELLVLVPFIISTRQEQGENKFTIRTTKRSITFRAPSSNEWNMWVGGLENIAKYHRKSNPLEPGLIKRSGQLGLKKPFTKDSVYVVVTYDKTWLFENIEAFADGVAMLYIEMNIAQVKQKRKKEFKIRTPNKTFVFAGESEREASHWVWILTEAKENALSYNEVAEKIWKVPENCSCADCGDPQPKWASVNLVLVICERCAGQHRALGATISKVRSLKMDRAIWTEPLIQLFIQVGNKGTNNIWAQQVPPSEMIYPGSLSDKRQTFIRDKYLHGKYRKIHKCFGVQEELDEALCNAVISDNNILETMQLVANGAQVTCNTGDPQHPTPIDLARRENQMLQLEFLRQNEHQDTPVPDNTIPAPVSPVSSKSNTFSLGKQSSEETPVPYYTTPAPVSPVSSKSDTFNPGKQPSEDMPVPDYISPALPGLSPFASLLNKKHVFEDRQSCRIKSNIMYLFNNRSQNNCDGIDLDQVVSLVVIPRGEEGTLQIITRRQRLKCEAKRSRVENLALNIIQYLAPTLTVDFEIDTFELASRVNFTDEHVEEQKAAWVILRGQELYLYSTGFTERIVLTSHVDINSVSFEQVLSILMPTVGRIWYLQFEWPQQLDLWHATLCGIVASGRVPHPLLSVYLRRMSETSRDAKEESIPPAVQTCLQFLTQYGLKVKGIYRLCGTKSKVAQLLDALKKNPSKLNLESGQFSVHDVASAFKQYLYNLEDCVFTNQLLTSWEHIAGLPDSQIRIQCYQKLLEKMTSSSRALLKAVLRHFHHVHLSSSENQMTADTLSLILAPTLLQDKIEYNVCMKIIYDFIFSYKHIFTVPSEAPQ
ncbi:arf-GAP with Rho-GAP domain, ANK repeat and PH domain-containing protein 1-like isoform X2 [Protopterus annectens]|uniref:arf-GAP with Rho-GAP domain, ANK repeat and PH domain-containing protein 1-like isoform X2 n=1 Tax=Protopterus annectens TaxID=7888 RepID=UPI001CF9AC27|nr:arf-GAP with Rho-GAP domain, ANK repeat and PH domain-containing protein 1-like isoform X2 [Protopterus annectens]